MNEKLENNKLISLAEASDFSGFSHDHLRRLAEQGKINAQKIGRNWVTTHEAVEDYLENRNPPGRPKNP